MLRQGAGLNQSDPACPANRRRCEAIAFAGCTVLAVGHRMGKEKAISGGTRTKTPPMPHVTSTRRSLSCRASISLLWNVDYPNGPDHYKKRRCEQHLLAR